jgi:hypothetical protein
MTRSAPRLFWHYLNSPRWWFGCLLTAGSVVGVVVLFWTWTTTAEDREFAAKGVRTVAQISLRSETPEWVGEDQSEMITRYQLHYYFLDPEGNEQTGVATVLKPTWLRYQAGDTLAIEYLADQPARNRALERQRPPLGIAGTVVFGLGLLLVLGGLILLGTAWVRGRRRWRIVRTGIPSLGRITEILASGARNGHDQPAAHAAYHLGYTFQDQRGVSHDGRTAALTPGLASRWHLGDPILVLYAPDDIFRHEVDLFGARAEDLNLLLNRSAL